MSPRRRVGTKPSEWAGTSDQTAAPQPQRGLLRLIGAVAAVLIVAAVALSAVVFAKNQAVRANEIRDAAVRTSVQTFLTQYTSPDPFNANDYAEKVLALGTGTFAKLYSEKMNEVVVQVARSEPGFGTVRNEDIGIERWNADGSASVIAFTSMVTKMPDGTKVDSSNRWEVTAVREGDQWKVSDLIQVL